MSKGGLFLCMEDKVKEGEEQSNRSSRDEWSFSCVEDERAVSRRCHKQKIVGQKQSITKGSVSVNTLKDKSST